MKTRLFPRALGAACLGASTLAATTVARGQLAFGVDRTGTLFSLDLSTPTSTTDIGTLGFLPEAIDFRPGTSTLYAIDVDAVTGSGRLYTVDTSTGTASAVGAGFVAAGLVGAHSIAFDFNPTTLQADGSVRIRLVGSNGANFRLHSDTGAIAITDGAINGVPGALTTGAAYTRSDLAVMAGAGTTALYYVDSASDALLFSTGPNTGAVQTTGSGLGVTVGETIGFDIYSSASGDTAYLVDTACIDIASFYSVDLGTGLATFITNIERDFTGGFAVSQPAPIPEPSAFAAVAGALALGWTGTRRRRAA